MKDTNATINIEKNSSSDALNIVLINSPLNAFLLLYKKCILKVIKIKKRLRGYVLLSQAVAHQVPLALKSLTSVFGMGTGVSSLL